MECVVVLFTNAKTFLKVYHDVVEDIKNAGHFIQEEAGEELAYLINDFIDGKL